jgi:hypothetical protein
MRLVLIRPRVVLVVVVDHLIRVMMGLLLLQGVEGQLLVVGVVVVIMFILILKPPPRVLLLPP